MDLDSGGIISRADWVGNWACPRARARAVRAKRMHDAYKDTSDTTTRAAHLDGCTCTARPARCGCASRPRPRQVKPWSNFPQVNCTLSACREPKTLQYNVCDASSLRLRRRKPPTLHVASSSVYWTTSPPRLLLQSADLQSCTIAGSCRIMIGSTPLHCGDLKLSDNITARIMKHQSRI